MIFTCARNEKIVQITFYKFFKPYHLKLFLILFR